MESAVTEDTTENQHPLPGLQTRMLTILRNLDLYCYTSNANNKLSLLKDTCNWQLQCFKD